MSHQGSTVILMSNKSRRAALCRFGRSQRFAPFGGEVTREPRALGGAFICSSSAQAAAEQHHEPGESSKLSTDHHGQGHGRLENCPKPSARSPASTNTMYGPSNPMGAAKKRWPVDNLAGIQFADSQIAEAHIPKLRPLAVRRLDLRIADCNAKVVAQRGILV